VKFKGSNPTGTVKDRTSATAVGAALQFGFGATSVVSSGNAGSSIAAYSARAGLRSLIFCYERASAPKMLHMAATASDLVIYKGVYDVGADDVSHRAGLARVLRQYITKVISDSSVEAGETKKLKTFATAVLKRIETESPFAELPAAERNLLLDIDRFIRANDRDSASTKLQDLASLIEVRQDAMDRLQSSNKWSVPLAVIGLVLTVLFGIVSLVK